MRYSIFATIIWLISNLTWAEGCVPSVPAPAASAVHAKQFGAFPDDSVDDTIALQRMLDSGQDGILDPGVYLTRDSLYVRRPGVHIFGDGARLHATNPDAQAVLIQADNVGVYGLRFTGVTDIRRTAPRHSRIAVYLESNGVVQPIRHVQIIGNTIAPDTTASGKEHNSSSAGGIELHRAVDFVVANNVVSRTLADGIHITDGSRDGKVVSNVVRETGDDMIAVVSYAGKGAAALNSSDMLGDLLARSRAKLAQNILIANNDLSGQYWGRGISVVGGKDVSILSNLVDNTPVAAGILIAREANNETFGVQNILIKNNHVSRVQTDRSPYDPDGTFATRDRTGHGALEVHASLFEDEASDADLRPQLAVYDIAFVGNVIGPALIPGLRSGVQFGGYEEATGPNGPVRRNVVTGDIGAVSIGAMSNVTGARITCSL